MITIVSHVSPRLSDAELAMLRHRLLAVPQVDAVEFSEHPRQLIVRLQPVYDAILTVRRLTARALPESVCICSVWDVRSESEEAAPSETCIG